MSTDTYTATIDGEYFEGKAVMVDASTSFATAFGSAYSNYVVRLGRVQQLEQPPLGKLKLS